MSRRGANGKGSRARARRAAAAAGGAFALALGACREAPPTPLADEALTEIRADQVTYGSSSFLTKDGVRTGEVRADSAYIFQDSAVAHMYGVTMTVFTEQGLERAHVVADSGRLEDRTEKMVAWGDVVVTMPEGNRRIETSELHYDPQSDRIWSDSATTFREGTRVTRGSCFRSDLQFQRRTVCDIRGSADIGAGARPDTAGGGGGAP